MCLYFIILLNFLSEKLSNEHGEKELNMRTKVELLQKNLNLEEQEHQKQKEANKVNDIKQRFSGLDN